MLSDACDEVLTLAWAGAPSFLFKGAPNEAFRVIEQELRDFLFKGAPKEAFRPIVQELRDNPAIFATGGFGEGLALVWAALRMKRFV